MILKQTLVRAMILLASVLIVTATSSSRGCMDDPPRAVWVEVQLRTPAGPALEAGVPITIIACRRKSWMGVTDANGFLRIRIDVSSACDWISVGILKYDFSSDGQAKQLRNWRRVVDLEEHWSVPADRQIKLVPGQDTYSTTVELVEGVRVNGRVVASDGSMRTVRVDREGRLALDAVLSAPKPWFNLTTVPKSASSLIFVSVGDTSSTSYVMKIIELNAAQTAQNVDLGTMTVDIPPLSVQAAFSITGFHQRPSEKPPGSPSLVAVRENGLDALVINFRDQLKAAGPDAQSVSVSEKLPEGTWYVLPGEYFNPAIMPAIRRLRAGDAAALDAANIPKIVIAVGQPPSVSIDYWAVFGRVEGITWPPPSPPPPAP